MITKNIKKRIYQFISFGFSFKILNNCLIDNLNVKERVGDLFR